MQIIEFTRHAQTRAQQRGIQSDVTEALLVHGSARISHGAEVVYMDKTARRAARKAMGEKAYARIADRLDCYLVVAADSAIVICAHRTDRLRFKNCCPSTRLGHEN